MDKQSLYQQLKQAKQRSAKPMLWFGMISIVMFFAGLTSAYVVSKQREDWVSFDLPQAFYVSTILIVLSSLSLFLSQRLLRRNLLKKSLVFLLLTLLLGLGFVRYQYLGFKQLEAIGLFFTGVQSTVSSSFLIGISFMHVLHLLAGIVVLLVVVYNHFRGKYTLGNMLGFELGAIFWHFLDILWVYLFLFFYFIR